MSYEALNLRNIKRNLRNNKQNIVGCFFLKLRSVYFVVINF